MNLKCMTLHLFSKTFSDKCLRFYRSNKSKIFIVVHLKSVLYVKRLKNI